MTVRYVLAVEVGAVRTLKGTILAHSRTLCRALDYVTKTSNGKLHGEAEQYRMLIGRNYKRTINTNIVSKAYATWRVSTWTLSCTARPLRMGHARSYYRYEYHAQLNATLRQSSRHEPDRTEDTQLSQRTPLCQNCLRSHPCRITSCLHHADSTTMQCHHHPPYNDASTCHH